MRKISMFIYGVGARVLSVILQGLLGCILLSGVAHAQLRTFGPVFHVDVPGDILIVGNTSLTCSTSTVAGTINASTCPAARDGTATPASQNNNNTHTMVNVMVDPLAPGGTNSSSAGLQLPSDGAVLWAGLYWGGTSGSATTRNKVSFKTPVAGYQTMTADWVATIGSKYHAGLTVTGLVTAGGSGNYTVADLKATASGGYGGWSLVVVYKSNSDKFRNLTVFDGFDSVSTSASLPIALSGFKTPSSGVVGARIGIVTYEGDFGALGDNMKLGTTTISDGFNPVNNVFNSSITRLGSRITDKNPDYTNQLGIDIDVISADGVLPNNATTTIVTLGSTSDGYNPGVITTAIEIFTANLAASLAKSVTDVNSGNLDPGDFLDYTISFSNTGQDTATSVVLTDPIPPGTTYVANSLQILTGANAGAKSDTAANDQAEYISGTNQVVFRLGTAANGVSGGSIAPTQSTSLQFRVKVNPGTNGQVINNTATVSYISQTLGTSYTANKSVAITVVALPLLTHQKTVQIVSDPINGTVNPKNIPGAIDTYTLSVSNTAIGSVDTNTLAIVDVIPTKSELFTGNLLAGAPFTFTDATVPSGVSCGFIALNNLTDCVDFSADGGATWVYVPNGSYDPAVTHIRFRLTGAMNGDAVAGAPYPGFDLKFRVRVK
jgi:uncharacterized repeat protein (TIGR01451 family)